MDNLASGIDRRWAIRRQIRLDAHLTDLEGADYSVLVIDVSEDGCRILIQTGASLVQERPHTIAIRGIEPLTASVVWSDKGQAGLVLAEPLHPAVVQRLVVKSLYGKIARQLAGPHAPESQ